MRPDATELRVLGCLIEKQRTTPDQYPLTLNALRLACNQSTNRDPVVDYGEHDIQAALRRLNDKGWAQLATWTERRTKKYRQLFAKQEGLSDGQEALMCLLMLRGPQTPAELRQRSDRLHHFEADEVELALEELAERDFAVELPRQPGQRGQRWTQTIEEEPEAPEPEPEKPFVSNAHTAEPPPPVEPAPPSSAGEGFSARRSDDAAGGEDLADRVGRLEREMAALKQTIVALRRDLEG